MTLAYDANNNLLSLTDPVSNTTPWLYDALNRQIQERPAGDVGNAPTMRSTGRPRHDRQGRERHQF